MFDFENDIENCLQVLRSGGIILYPTDTIWGLGCDATNEAAVEKIIELKNRPPEKSFVVLVATEREVLKYAASVDLSLFDFLEQQQNPTTVIYDHALGLAANVIAPNGSVAMRICRDNFCKHLIKRFQKPIVSTSANISGETAPKFFSEITDPVKLGVDYMVHYRQQDNLPKMPSSIIKWHKGEVIKIR
ncbi:MAG: threonylcarbamoyl-AMP synthase [Sphingobacteriia bacterium]|nr:threonylcarbamoyl-AMP synthase [Sphingobacteriia bacterium]